MGVTQLSMLTKKRKCITCMCAIISKLFTIFGRVTIKSIKTASINSFARQAIELFFFFFFSDFKTWQPLSLLGGVYSFKMKRMKLTHAVFYSASMFSD